MADRLIAAFFRWVGASAIGMFIVVCASVAAATSWRALAVAALLLVLAPLLLARRWPTAGAWLAAVMLAASPGVLLMTLGSVNGDLIVSHSRCGNPIMALWLFFMPLMQIVLALFAEPLWKYRRRLASVWGPLSLGALVLGLTMLVPGTLRHLEEGAATRDSVLDIRTTTTELPAAAPHSTTTVEVADLVVKRECKNTHCELALGSTQHPEREPQDSYRQWPVGEPLLVHTLDRWRVVESKPHDQRYGQRMAFDVEKGRFDDLQVRDVAHGFGPSPSVLGLLLLAVGAVLGSTVLRPYGPLVWRRLGAAIGLGTHTEPVIALRMVHLAVLMIAGIPLLASAWHGLVF